MSDGVKISALPPVVALDGTEVFPVVQNGETRKAPLTASSLAYHNTSYPTVEAALDTLLYVAPSASFSLSVGTVEIGSTVTAVTASWSFNKAMATVALTDASIAVTDTSHAFTGLSLTSNKTYTLSYSDGTNSGSASRTVAFSSKRYWGVSASATLDDAAILALSSEFSSSKSKAITYNCTGGRYFYFCYPAASGLPANVTVGGLAFSDYTVTVQALTNASGYTQNYNVVRCNNLQTGASISVVWA
jgi:hypothetical protein